MFGFLIALMLLLLTLTCGGIAIIFGLLNYPLFSLLFIGISFFKMYLFVQVSKTLWVKKNFTIVLIAIQKQFIISVNLIGITVYLVKISLNLPLSKLSLILEN